MKIAVIGAGHVGLVTGACFSDLGNDVICMDHDKNKIAVLKTNKIPFYEPGLLELVKKNVANGRLRFSTSIRDTVRFGRIIFLCVGTPPRSDGEADLAAIEHVALDIAANLTDYRLIVEKSTVPVETGAQLERTIREQVKKKISFDIASNPEFLREGTAVTDFFSPDRIVIGVSSKRAEQLFRQLYQPFKTPIVVTDIRSAEMIKHASNSFLATKISFINFVSQLCEQTGANIQQVAEGMGLDPRIGRSFLAAGIGFGGSCFPKDLSAFMRISEKRNVSSGLLKEVLAINEAQKIRFVQRIEEALWNFNGKTVAALGLAFKPETDDLREAPAIDILNRLILAGVRITAYDPCAMPAAKKIVKKISFARNPYEACHGADAVLIFTEWREFKELDLKKLKRVLKRPVVIDGRNIYDPVMMKKLGFHYYSVGQKNEHAGR